MRTDYVKAALMAGWILAVGGLGYELGATSFTAWTLVAVLSVVPPVLVARVWKGRSPTMSESIREVLR